MFHDADTLDSCYVGRYVSRLFTYVHFVYVVIRRSLTDLTSSELTLDSWSETGVPSPPASPRKARTDCSEARTSAQSSQIITVLSTG